MALYSIWIAAASNFAGPERCQMCHLRQYSTQSRSQHALALRPILVTRLPELLAEQPLRERSGISFSYKKTRDGVTVSVAQEERTASARLEWAFGSGAQAFTPVGTIDGHYFEHRISYYSAASGARRTLGHPGTPSPDPKSALGILQTPETIFRCFNCHATGVASGPDLRSMIAGVTCERCHGPAAEHAVHGTKMRSAKLSRDGVMTLCGSCHRLPSESNSRTPEVQDPLSIRFAPVGLAASQCYQKSSDLSCLTCHDPHLDASHEQSSYVARCIGCHNQSNSCRAGARADCLRCHMQRRSPAPYLTFTDHRIRIYDQVANRAR